MQLSQNYSAWTISIPFLASISNIFNKLIVLVILRAES